MVIGCAKIHERYTALRVNCTTVQLFGGSEQSTEQSSQENTNKRRLACKTQHDMFRVETENPLNLAQHSSHYEDRNH